MALDLIPSTDIAPKRWSKVVNDRRTVVDAAATVDRIASGALADLTPADIAELAQAAKVLESVGCYIRRTIA